MTDERKVFVSPPRTVTEGDINTFANSFFTPLLGVRAKEAHATMILPIVDGVAAATPGLDTEIQSVRKGLVGDLPATTLVSLGWSNWKLHKPLRAGDTIRVSTRIVDSRTSKSRPGMVIINLRKIAHNQDGEKLVEVDHAIGIF
jgi:acyl dehydratase